jgi:hypothetical protein
MNSESILKSFYDNLDDINLKLDSVIKMCGHDDIVKILFSDFFLVFYDCLKKRYTEIRCSVLDILVIIPLLGYQTPVICQGIKTQIISEPEDGELVKVAYFLYPQEYRTLKPIKV